MKRSAARADLLANAAPPPPPHKMQRHVQVVARAEPYDGAVTMDDCDSTHALRMRALTLGPSGGNHNAPEQDAAPPPSAGAAAVSFGADESTTRVRLADARQGLLVELALSYARTQGAWALRETVWASTACGKGATVVRSEEVYEHLPTHVARAANATFRAYVASGFAVIAGC